MDYGEVKKMVRKEDDDVIPKLCQRKCYNFCPYVHKIFSLSQYRVYHLSKSHINTNIIYVYNHFSMKAVKQKIVCLYFK